MKRIKRAKDQKGTSTLELVVVLPTRLFIFFSIMELSRAWLTVNIVTTASREGARTGVVTPLSGGSFNPGPAEARIDAILASANITSGVVRNVTCTSPCETGAQVQANVQVIFDTIMPAFLPLLTDININRTSTMRYE
jgi:hypothetical protein